ncbi:hypothetical protein H0R92_13445 [Treponema sp. OMZ 840]|uniref:hypothetical protein n=1 Tax=Treponema sp. OMZ 840 TaxID=244313 RepID=UPI003D90F221
MLSALGNLHGIAQTRYNAAALSRISSAAAGKLHVPVAPSLVGYTQFKHVAGVAAADGQRGVNISKISILNTLIERLTSIKKAVEVHTDTAQLSDAQIDALIETYQNRIQNIVNTAKSNPYALGGAPVNQTGALFSVSV